MRSTVRCRSVCRRTGNRPSPRPASGTRRASTTAPLLALALLAAAPGGAASTLGGPSVLGNFVLAPPAAVVGRFGAAVASGDFDGDGRVDLAVGVTYDATGGAFAGAVNLYHRTAAGGLQLVDRYEGPAGAVTGWALAAGDFDADGRDDLAVARISETVGGAAGAGRVVVLRWNEASAQLAEGESFQQGMAGLGETAETNDGFGRTLASGDFNGDGTADLAIGVPFEDHAVAGVNQGLVHVLLGFENVGLTTFGVQTWTQNSASVLGVVEANDQFGWSLAAGDFDQDNFDDLAIGVPGELVGGVAAGGVAVLYGTAGGLNWGGNQLWVGGGAGLPGPAAAGDQLGYAVAAGDFGGDGRDDLAIGAPGTEVGALVDAGTVLELFGSAAGLTGAGSRRWSRASFGSAGQTGDGFGTTLVSGDFDDDGRGDLAIGMPWAPTNPGVQGGKLDTVLGSPTGLDATKARRFTADTLASTPAAPGDEFGLALAAGDFDGDGDEDLFVGLPGRRGGNPPVAVGAVQVLRGRTTLFDDDFELGGVAGWSDWAP